MVDALYKSATGLLQSLASFTYGELTTPSEALPSAALACQRSVRRLGSGRGQHLVLAAASATSREVRRRPVVGKRVAADEVSTPRTSSRHRKSALPATSRRPWWTSMPVEAGRSVHRRAERARALCVRCACAQLHVLQRW